MLEDQRARRESDARDDARRESDARDDARRESDARDDALTRAQPGPERARASVERARVP